jgi:hypothetical protein
MAEEERAAVERDEGGAVVGCPLGGILRRNRGRAVVEWEPFVRMLIEQGDGHAFELFANASLGRDAVLGKFEMIRGMVVCVREELLIARGKRALIQKWLATRALKEKKRLYQELMRLWVRRREDREEWFGVFLWLIMLIWCLKWVSCESVLTFLGLLLRELGLDPVELEGLSLPEALRRAWGLDAGDYPGFLTMEAVHQSAEGLVRVLFFVKQGGDEGRIPLRRCPKAGLEARRFRGCLRNLTCVLGKLTGALKALDFIADVHELWARTFSNPLEVEKAAAASKSEGSRGQGLAGSVPAEEGVERSRTECIAVLRVRAPGVPEKVSEGELNVDVLEHVLADAKKLVAAVGHRRLRPLFSSLQVLDVELMERRSGHAGLVPPPQPSGRPQAPEVRGGLRWVVVGTSAGGPEADMRVLADARLVCSVFGGGGVTLILDGALPDCAVPDFAGWAGVWEVENSLAAIGAVARAQRVGSRDEFRAAVVAGLREGGEGMRVLVGMNEGPAEGGLLMGGVAVFDRKYVEELRKIAAMHSSVLFLFVLLYCEMGVIAGLLNLPNAGVIHGRGMELPVSASILESKAGAPLATPSECCLGLVNACISAPEMRLEQLEEVVPGLRFSGGKRVGRLNLGRLVDSSVRDALRQEGVVLRRLSTASPGLPVRQHLSNETGELVRRRGPCVVGRYGGEPLCGPVVGGGSVPAATVLSRWVSELAQDFSLGPARRYVCLMALFLARTGGGLGWESEGTPAYATHAAFWRWYNIGPGTRWVPVALQRVVEASGVEDQVAARVLHRVLGETRGSAGGPGGAIVAVHG